MGDVNRDALLLQRREVPAEEHAPAFFQSRRPDCASHVGQMLVERVHRVVERCLEVDAVGAG